MCTRCGRAAERLRIRRDAVPFRRRLAGIFSYPLSGPGLFTIAAIAGIALLFAVIGWRSFGLGVALAYMFFLARRTASGHHEIEPPDFTSLADVYGPLVRLSFAAAVFLPLTFWLRTQHPATPRDDQEDVVTQKKIEQQVDELKRLTAPPAVDSNGEVLAPPGAPAVGAPAPYVPPALQQALVAEAWRARARREAAADPVVWLLTLFAALFFPAALIGAATYTPLLTILNPVALIAWMRTLGIDYWLYTGVLVGLAVVEGSSEFLMQAIFPSLPVVVMVTLVSAYFTLVQGRALGLLLYVRGSDLGYSAPEDAYELDTQLEPRGKLPESAAAPSAAGHPASDLPDTPQPPPVRRRAITLDEVPAVLDAQPAAVIRPETLDASTLTEQSASELSAAEASDSELSASEGELQAQSPGARQLQATPSLSPDSLVTEALGRQDVAGALAAFERHPDTAYPLEVLVKLGKAAAASGFNEGAVQVLQRAADVGRGSALGAQALVLLGRVYAERLNQPEAAARVYTQVATQYPNTPAAKFAADKLGAAS